MQIKKIVVAVSVILLVLGLFLGVRFYNNIHTVVEGKIYRSGQLSGSRLEKLIQTKNIKSIINLRGEHRKKEWFQTEKTVSKEYSLAHYDFEFKPHFLPDYTQINRLVDLLLKVEKPYLIHCWRGAERAGMASALILSIEKDLPLDTLKRQFSIWYGVIYPYDSVGGLFFNEYENWLTGSKTSHSKDILLSFIKNEYIDYHGNIKYYIDSAAGIGFGKEKQVTIQKSMTKFPIRGWAYDAKRLRLVDRLHLKIGNSVSVQVENKIKRPDVIKFWKLESERQYLSRLGWEVILDRSKLPVGCHDLQFSFIYPNKENITFKTGFTLCIE